MRLTRHLLKIDLTIGLAGLGLIGASLIGMSSASAADPVSDGSDWGPQGELATASAQTVSWDNSGNPADSIVPRNATQVVPHTGGKTYADIPAATRTLFTSKYGANNGRGGLKVTVAQTQNLVNQGVAVTISGSAADIDPGVVSSHEYFQIMQCWGAPKADGTPDPSATSPDPSTCQFGAPGPDSVGGAQSSFRNLNGDPLVGAGSDWAPYLDADSPQYLNGYSPFAAIKGTLGGSGTFFGPASTNEFDSVYVPASGTVTRQFEMQTGAESSGLGCGANPNSPSTPTCWLVVVPRYQDIDTSIGATAPSAWAERLQVKLGFQDAGTSCPGGQGQSLLGGSEMLDSATTSWIPGVCRAEDVTLGYNKLSDQLARTQYASKASHAILTSEPVTSGPAPTVVPLALAAPVISYSWTYRPTCTAGVALEIAAVNNDADAKTCGYDDLAALKADLAKAGQPIRDLNLSPLMVAKMLTQSYSQSFITVYPLVKPSWAATAAMPATLTADPDFAKLNPQLHIYLPGTDISSFVVDGARNDAATEVWRWLMADPAAHSFLSGCPDAHGYLINPFYSTGTYVGCEGQAAALEASAIANRASTATPSTFTFVRQSYPPEFAPYPLPQWEEVPALVDGAGQVTQRALTLTDWQPQVTAMSVAARDAFVGLHPRNADWCPISIDITCTPAPGKYVQSPSSRQTYDKRQVFSITDTASAARYQLSTAKLCDDAGSACVGADADSLSKAAADFVPSATSGFQVPAATPNYAGGAYPLTLPVYAAVDSTLDDATRASYANAFSYITSDGQDPGLETGDLPPGYAPMTAAMKAQATTGIAALRVPLAKTAAGSNSSLLLLVVKPTNKPTRKPTSKPSASASATPSASASASVTTAINPTPGTDNGGDDGGTLITDVPSGGSVSAVPSAAASASASVAAVVQTTPVSASTESWPGWVLPLGLGLALGAGAAGPFLRRRTNVRLR